jgi:threonine/homoserine/homoserine lactone efflux protein
MIGYIVKGATLGLSAAAMPGPFQAYLLSQTMKHGWRRAMPAVLAPLLSDGPIVLLVLVILSQVPPLLLNLISIVGGLFLIYLAWVTYRAFKTSDLSTEAIQESTAKNLFKATLVNFLSPGPYIFWSTITGPLFLEGWREAPGIGVSFVASFYGSFLLWLAGFVLLFALARRAGPTVIRVLLAIATLALLLFGIYQIVSGIISYL